jgi:hypothetical protein
MGSRWMDGWMDGRMDEWVVDGMDGWMDGWMSEWTDSRWMDDTSVIFSLTTQRGKREAMIRLA